ncbi:MAG: PspA/IM30 family protein [Bdellovibrionales bacterium]|nr:PspA/IM30 family protein [Bdellovibrionales bacterium]
MREGIAGRVGRIVAGSFNAIVDAVENAAPEVVMEQALREIDDAIADVRSELGKEVAKKHLANKRLLEENRKHDELSEQIVMALSDGREDLAEAAVSKQLDIEAQIPVLENSITECSETEAELEGYISALQAKKREMSEELKQYKSSRSEAASPVQASSEKAVSSSSSVQTRVEQAESAFDRVLAAQTGVGSSGAATRTEDAAKLAELEDLARKNRIQERLAEIKSKVQK